MSERESEQPFFMLKNVFTSMTFQLSNPLLFKFQLWYLNLALTHSHQCTNEQGKVSKMSVPSSDPCGFTIADQQQ